MPPVIFRMLRSMFSAPVPAQPHALGARLEALQERMGEMEKLAYARYQVEAAQLIATLLADPRYDDPLRLERCGYKVYSQNDEDGLLAEIFRRIGETNRSFLEIGVGDGLENNTRSLLERGWTGAWLEADPDCAARIRSGLGRRLAGGQLKLCHDVVDRDNVNALVSGLGLPQAPDLVSIDIDGNDYYVWEVLAAIEPRVVVIEYNAKFRPPVSWQMPYDPAFRWKGDDQFGSSLAALEALGRRKGYRLVGCNITGANAFFVEEGLAGAFAAAAAADLYQPARYFLTASFVSGHPPGYGG
jgi:hypothetical protein